MAPQSEKEASIITVTGEKEISRVSQQFLNAVATVGQRSLTA